MTVAALASVICLASGIWGRPAWTEERCAERAELVLDVATRHDLDPLLFVALDVWECEQRERDAKAYRTVRGRKTHVGYDACPMGVRVIGFEKRKKLSAADLHELAARKLVRWRKWCAKGHPGFYDGPPPPHHFVAHYNQGNWVYAAQVLSVRATLAGREIPIQYRDVVTPRAAEIIRRYQRLAARRTS